MTQTDNPESESNIPEANENSEFEENTLESLETLTSTDSVSREEVKLDEAAKEIEKLKVEIAQAQDKYLRSLADFENFKKRAQKERSELLKYQGEQLIIDLLGVIDDLELAIQFKDGEFKDSDPENFRKGVELIYKRFCDILRKWDIRSDSSLGKAFDPVKNLAISRIVSADSDPGTVVSELKKAFFYKDKIIRVGEVVVATEPAS